MNDITLDDIAANTIFTAENGIKYQKGSTGTYGEKGYTICYPQMGGIFQKSAKFEAKIPNNSKVSVSSRETLVY